MAVITPQLITSLRTGFSKIFQNAYENTPSDWEKIATRVESKSSSNTYGWLGQFPRLREWVGDRVIKSMRAQAYQIVNRTFESTVEVSRADIEDDNVGIYAPLFEEMGRAVKVFPDELVFELLKNGHQNPCYDGQNFFDTDHPVFPEVDGTGTPTLVSNNDVPATGAGPAWFLLDTSKAIKPFIFQERTKPELETITSTDNSHVFMRDAYLYGVRYRCNAGYGLWQLAYRSQQPLTADNLKKAISAMKSFKADGGRPLGIKPTLLVVPTELEWQARALVEKQFLPNGDSNELYKVVDILVSPWLSS
ncbi:MAG: Mu-like prophage major head subunit gpT family protein [Fervidobacterium sp.]|nr:Mu-like prophage major head subunit gpT family protein [Fervidobacterium sp.]